MCYQNKSKQKVMKKFIFAAYTIALVVLAPAVFVGYLTSSNTTPIAQKEMKIEKTNNPEAEASFPVVTLLVAVK